MLKNKFPNNIAFDPSDCVVFFDFDNTVSVGDILDDIIKRFSINDNWVSLQNDWLKEKISAKECLLGQMKGVRVSKQELNKYLSKVSLDPHFFKLLQWLRALGIEPVIVSDNFKPIIEQILIHKEIKGLKVYANQLRFLKDGLSLSFPYQNKDCLMCAHCKKTQFKKIDPTGKKKIIYIGDGRSDICAALSSDVVFAKDTLLKYFKKHQLDCFEFSGLVDVHDQLQEIFNGAVVASR